jgi:hypothetical protein
VCQCKILCSETWRNEYKEETMTRGAMFCNIPRRNPSEMCFSASPRGGSMVQSPGRSMNDTAHSEWAMEDCGAGPPELEHGSVRKEGAQLFC